MPWYAVLILALAIVVLPFAIGHYFARAVRMPDYWWRIGVVLFALFAGIAITVLGWPPKFGVDLRGGVILVYDAIPREDEEERQAGQPAVDMDRLSAAISKRINPGGVKEIVIRPYGPEQIEIIIPEADAEEVRRIEQRISRSGTLEFRIVANRVDHAELINRAERSRERQIEVGGRRAEWVPVDPRFREEFAANQNFATRPMPADPEQLEVLVVLDRYSVTGDRLRTASAGVDERGRDAVNFVFDSRGARDFLRLTGENIPDPVTGHTRQLGIILDGRMYNAPNIQSAIAERGIIQGEFTRDEVEDLVTVLRAGSLPATLSERPVSSQLIDPTLGADTIERGQRAMAISMVAVVLFMLVYYRFAGIVACFALALNLVLILAVMITIQAAFTLPGLAGLVLTVGMAVDANVLIFERIREEMGRGAALRMAIRNGFSRATRTVVDANLTTLITATVLYAIGTDQIRGFAVTLWLGIVMSMFTAIFCTRVIFDVAERAGWLRKLSMLRIIGQTNFDFMGKRYVAAAFSMILIVAGLAAVVGQGSNLFGIDFTEGVAVELQFRQPEDVADVRAELAGQLPDVSVSRLTRIGEEPGLRYQITTTESDIDHVEARLDEIFGRRLAHNSFVIDQLAAIQPGAANPPRGASPATETPAAEPAAGDQSSAGSADSAMLVRRDSLLSSAIGALALLQPGPPDSDEPSADEAAQPAGAEATAEPPEADAAAPGDAIEDGEDVRDHFAGGTEARLTFERPIDAETLSAWFEEELRREGTGYAHAAFQVEMIDDGEGHRDRSPTWVVRLALPEAEAREVLGRIQERLAGTPYFPSSVVVGATVAGDTRVQAVNAMLASLLFITAYIWIRFQKVVYGFAAVVALIHDVMILLGALAISHYVAPYLGILMIEPFKIDLPIIAAFLTIVGYSLNDTIVVFDRIREVKGKSPDLTIDMLNQSINQTLSRTLLTSLTTFIVVLVLYIGGGQGLHAFTFALMVGVIVGTYSSVYVAAPVLNWFVGTAEKRAGKAERAKRGAALPEATRT